MSSIPTLSAVNPDTETYPLLTEARSHRNVVSVSEETMSTRKSVKDTQRSTLLTEMTRREVIVGGAASIAMLSLVSPVLASRLQSSHSAAPRPEHHRLECDTVIVKDGTRIHFKDWGGIGSPIVFSHGWPLNADAWGARDALWAMGMQASIVATYDGIRAQSETDFTGDLEAINIPTLIVHGGDDQLVPIDNSAILSSKIIKNSILKVYPGAPHGLTVTHADQLNADLLAFRCSKHSSNKGDPWS